MLDDVSAKGAPSLPSWFLLPATAVFAVITIYIMLRTPGRASRYLIFACWLRYTLSSLHEYTYKVAFGSVSYTALGSLFIIAVGLIVLEKRRFLILPFLPVMLICLLMLVSAILNQAIIGAVEPITRILFFSVIAVATWQAVDSIGPAMFRRLLWTFLPPLVFLMASIALGVANAGERDGSVSYIGGFYHEQQFSLILATCFLITIFATSIGRLFKFALSTASIVGIFVANYRTTILGIAPLAIVQLIVGVPFVFRRSQRGAVLAVMLVAGIAAIGLAVVLGSERFADLGILFREGGGIISPPESFTTDERHVLSGRPYIWSGYIYAYNAGSLLQHIIGFGPDSWADQFPVYAHNTAVSFLYELGILGFIAIFLLWGTMFALALRVPKPLRSSILAAHVGFFILNMATMPHWQIEGNIFYGLLCGYTLALARSRAPQRSEARMPIDDVGFGLRSFPDPALAQSPPNNWRPRR